MVIWEEFMNFIEKNKLEPLPEAYTDSRERLAFRFMQAVYWDHQRSYDAIFEHKCWVSLNLPIDPEPIIPLLSQGLMYLSCRAKPGLQPVLVVNGEKFASNDNISLDQIEQLSIYVFDWIVKNLLVPGRIESWIILLDMNNVKFYQIPVSRLKTFVKTIQLNFRGRLFRLFVVNNSWLLRSFWGIIYPLFDEYVKQKIIIKGDTDSSDYQSEVVD